MSSKNSTLHRKLSDTDSRLLQKAILGNAIFSGTSGLLFLLFSNPAAGFLGLEENIWILGVGVILLLYTPVLYWISKRTPVEHWIAWLIIGLDILWIVGSVILIFGIFVEFSIPGKWAIAIVADIVAVFAIAQYLGLRKQV